LIIQDTISLARKGHETMSSQWYYQNKEGIVGPVTAAELKFLVVGRKIQASTLVRKGNDGQWLAANAINELVDPVSGVESVDGLDHQGEEWRFSGKAHEKQAPVSWDALKTMASEGMLQPDDLVWKPGMTTWVPASQVAALWESSSPIPVRKTRAHGKIGLQNRPRVLWTGAAILILLGLVASAAAWKWARTESRGVLAVGARRPTLEKAGSAKPGPGDTERELDDVLAAVAAGQLDRATRLLDQYLSSPSAKQVGAARLLQREIEMASSTSAAAAVANNLSDEQIKSYLRLGVQSLIASIQTPELRSIYERTLLWAFRQENSRRQFVPRAAIAQNADPGQANRLPDKEDPQPKHAVPEKQQEPPGDTKMSVLGRPDPRKRGAEAKPALEEDDNRPDGRAGPDSSELNDVLARPRAFVGRTVTLKGLYKIGTRLSEVSGADRQVLGWSLPVGRTDDSTVCTGESKVNGYNVYMLLEDRLAPFLDRIFRQLEMRTTVKPTYKCILTVTTRRMLVNGSQTPVVVISSLEVLGGCDYLKVAEHQYERAFKTLKVTPEEARVDFGDGNDWVERLGGEEKFIQVIRSKLREMRRRAVTNRQRDLVDRVLQPEVAKAIDHAIAINQIRAMEAMMRRRILP